MAIGHIVRGSTGNLPRKLLGSVMLLIMLLCITACGGEGFNAAHGGSEAKALLELKIGSKSVSLSWEEHDVLCEQSRRYQLEEFLDMKLRHSRETAGGHASPLLGARHALEEAQLNYDQAREEVRLDCYHRRKA